MSTPFDSSTDSDDEPRRRSRFLIGRRPQSAPLPDALAPLECRFSREVYVVIGIWILTGLGLQISAAFSPRPNALWEMTALCVVMFHLPNLFFIYWAERIRVRADEAGLRFRGLGKTRFVPWHDIEDFGWKMADPGSKSQGARALLFIRGRRKPKHLSRNLTHFDSLLERIAQNAPHARVSSWQPLEARDEGEWPKIFLYRDVSGWRLVAAYLGFTLMLLVLMFFKAATTGLAPVLSNISMTWSGLTPGGRVAFAAMPLLVCGTYPLMILARFPSIKAARRFQGQHIIATREGLTFERESQSTFVAWSDIDRFELESLPGHFQLPLGVVHTKRDRYEFHTGIAKGRELKSLIAYRATNAQNSTWEYAVGNDEDILGGPRSLWRGGVVGVGPRIHHYRTRTNRVVLFFGMALFAPMPSFTVYGRFVNGAFKAPDLGDRIMFVVFFVLLFLPTLWGIIAYWFSAVEVDDGGLRQRGVWGEKKLSWSQIKSAKFNGYCLEIRGDKQVLRIGPIADLSYLCEEIQRRSHIQIKRTEDFKLGA